jgi:hypothetical protein
VFDKLIDLYYRIVNYIQNKQILKYRNKLDYEEQKTALVIEKDNIDCGKINSRTLLYDIKTKQLEYKAELGKYRIPLRRNTMVTKKAKNLRQLKYYEDERIKG